MRHWIREDRSHDLGKWTDNKTKEYEFSGVSYERGSWCRDDDMSGRGASTERWRDEIELKGG